MESKSGRYDAYVLMGGNMGNRLDNLRLASTLIQERSGQVLASSSIYETAAWGLTDQPDFLNQAILLRTSLPPEELMQVLLSIEEQMGRKRAVKMGPRIIDLDILLINDLVIFSALLTIPHPALPKRRFALLPLYEIAPHLLHPVEKKPISQLLRECTDTLDVQKFTVPTE